MTAAGSVPTLVVTSARTAARRGPSQRAEMVTEWLCGESLAALEQTETWFRCRGPDGYEAWTTRGGLLSMGREETAAWARRATAVSTGTALQGVSGSRVPSVLPWGARIVVRSDELVELADGALGRPHTPSAVVRAAERPSRFPTRPDAVTQSGLRWLGAPYLWGGRTPSGADCSGFVQAVFALHGFDLPRDSRDQRHCGTDVAVDAGSAAAPDLIPGDLLFFASGAGEVSHVAIALGGTRILHASEARGCVGRDDLASSDRVCRWLREALVAVRRLEGAGSQVP